MDIKKLIMFSLIILMVVNNAAGEGETEINGYIENRGDVRLSKPNDIMKLNNILNLKLNSSLDENVSAYAEMDLKYAVGNKDFSGFAFQYQDTDNYLGINFSEAYVTTSFGIFDIRIGKQKVSWGKSDALGPVDNINPMDFKEFDILNFYNMKIGMNMIKVNAYVIGDYLSIEGILISSFFPNEYPDQDSVWAFYQSPLPSIMIINNQSLRVIPDYKDTAYPGRKIKNSEKGLRISSSVGGYDFSVSYFYTWDDNPTIHQKINPDFTKTNVYIEITSKHHKLHIIGMDMATAISDFALRMETAYFITEDEKGKDKEIDDPYIKWAIGCDYSFWDDYQINIQFSEKVQNVNFRTCKNAETQNTIIGGLSGKFYEERLDISVSCFYEIEDKDYLITPKIEYSSSDSLAITLGINIFEGKQKTLLGQYDKNDAVFIDTKYSF